MGVCSVHLEPRLGLRHLCSITQGRVPACVHVLCLAHFCQTHPQVIEQDCLIPAQCFWSPTCITVSEHFTQSQCGGAQVLELLAEHLAQWSCSIAVPELLHLPLLHLPKFAIQCTEVSLKCNAMSQIVMSPMFTSVPNLVRHVPKSMQG